MPERFNPERRLYDEERLLRQMEWSVGLDDSEILLKGIDQDLRDFNGGCWTDEDQALLLVIIR